MDTFSAREMEIMAKAQLCMDKPKVDYEKLAGLCGFTNPRSASNAWAQIGKKMAKIAEDAGDADAAPTPKSAAGKKRGKNSTDDETSPVKKAKKAAPKKTKKAAKVKEEAVKEESDEETADANEQSDGDF